MSGDDFGRLIYLVLLGAVVASWFFVQNRQSMGKTLQQAALWGLIFIGFVAAYGLWQNIQDDHAVQSSFSAEDAQHISLDRQSDGHFYATLNIGGTPIEFLIDTGATDIVLTPKDAASIGVDVSNLKYLGTANTANGTVKTAFISLEDIDFEGFKTDRLPAYVNSGELDISLLGMGYLDQMRRIEIVGDKMILTP